VHNEKYRKTTEIMRTIHQILEQEICLDTEVEVGQGAGTETKPTSSPDLTIPATMRYNNNVCRVKQLAAMGRI